MHDALVAQVPTQQAQLDADLAQTLSDVPNGPAKSAGIVAGRRQAHAVLAERQSDGLDTASVDTPLTPPAPGPGVWQPTPPTSAPAIRAAINIQYVQVLRAVLADTHRPLQWDARFVAAFNVITTDAQIAIYNAKFKYVFWRPVTAIQTGSVDPDPGWAPLFTTPRYPDWPSGHGGVAGPRNGC